MAKRKQKEKRQAKPKGRNQPKPLLKQRKFWGFISIPSITAIVTLYLNVLYPNISLTVLPKETDLFAPIFTLQNDGPLPVKVAKVTHHIIGVEFEGGTIQDVTAWNIGPQRDFILPSGGSNSMEVPIDVASVSKLIEASTCFSISVRSCLYFCIFSRTIERGFFADKKTGSRYWRFRPCEELIALWKRR